MNTTLYEIKEPEVGGSCPDPDIRKRLATYITNPLEYPSAEDVENHLLDCRDCREFFLAMLKLRSYGSRSEKIRREELNEGPVLKLADTKN